MVHLDLKHTGIVQSALQDAQAVEELLQMRAGQGTDLSFGLLASQCISRSRDSSSFENQTVVSTAELWQKIGKL